ncbi:hypothetical protein B0J17DRAFT_709080 [Rhizoctonia solani]|nr:hypothetical protein B0J17DRAFT_709080 [Rhizoctonia solani]
MRHLWFSLLLALGVRGALLLPRGLPGLDSVDRLLDVRQVVSITSSAIVFPTQPITSTIPVQSDPPTTGTIVASLTTNLVATPTSNSVPALSNAPTTTSQTTPATTSSVPLLFTQTSTSARPSSSSETNTATSAPLTDINVPFSQSKYHQLIIALLCFAVGLLIAFIVTVILALRARSDVDSLRDRLNRYEEGLFMTQRKNGSSYDIGYEASRSFGQQSYGRVSMSDPDDTLGSRSRRSMSEGQGQFGSLASTKPGQGGTATGRPQPGNRRVTFSDEGHQSLLSTTTSRGPAPQYYQVQPLAPAPKPINPYDSVALVQSPPQLTSSPPPQSNFASPPFAPPLSHPPSLQPRMSDPGRVATPPIRRLPTTPGASSSSLEGAGYADPLTSRHDLSTSEGYPPY